jgi:serine palmitoyltransferase
MYKLIENKFIKIKCIFVIIYLIINGILRDIFTNKDNNNNDKDDKDFRGLSWFKEKYTKHIYGYASPCFERKVNKLNNDGTINIENNNECINFGSYNYLGFGGSKPENEFENFFGSYDDENQLLSCCCTMNDMKDNIEYLNLLERTENEFSKFIGTESTVIFPMGWGTNVNVIPIFCDKDTLIMSDEYNHASIAMGCKLIGCKVIPFRNNDYNDLEFKLITELNKHIISKNKYDKKDLSLEIVYSKIIIIIEGLYSMEGNISYLREFVRIKNTYKTYLYVDEAHSIGALGSNGKGICEYYDVNTKDVDILMGTFTKSFSSIGGYISGSSKLINYVKSKSPGIIYDTCISPICLKQILNVLKSKDFGTNVNILRENTKYIRNLLKKNNIKILGQDDSPVIPILTYDIITMTKVSEYCKKIGIALVVAGYPATPIDSSRVRLCISADHTIDQLNKLTNGLIKILSK